jgi:hypothetical protein
MSADGSGGGCSLIGVTMDYTPFLTGWRWVEVEGEADIWGPQVRERRKRAHTSTSGGTKKQRE